MAGGKKKRCCCGMAKPPPSHCTCRMEDQQHRGRSRGRGEPVAVGWVWGDEHRSGISRSRTLGTFGCWSERTNPAARPPAAPSPCEGPISHPRRSFSPQPRLWPVELLTDSRICRGRTGPAKPPPVPDPLPQPPHRPAGAAGSQWAAGHPPAQPRRQPRHPQARQTGWSTSPPAFSSLPHKLPLLFLLLTSPDPSFQATERDLQAFGLRSPPCGGMQKRDRRERGKTESTWGGERGMRGGMSPRAL